MEISMSTLTNYRDTSSWGFSWGLLNFMLEMACDCKP